MTDLLSALALGVLAGLAVALPLGPVGLLVVQTGLTRGLRVGVGAALGVAAVDGAYAVLAVSAGAAVRAVVEPRAVLVQLVGAAVLVGVGVHGLRSTSARPAAADVGRDVRRPEDTSPPAEAVRPVAPNRPRVLGPIRQARQTRPRPGEPVRAALRFVGLTALNPLTALTFVTVAVTLADGLGRGLAAAFVVGVAAASAGWQLTLAGLGALASHRVPARVQAGLSLGGHGLVIVLAVAMAVRGTVTALG
ncbi:hypothetical protein AGMMS50218_12020 [Actinomycetota bacterium]|nr:hypothetical protein AGMMS50218_12020 [Actinomycetota bacterium]